MNGTVGKVTDSFSLLNQTDDQTTLLEFGKNGSRVDELSNNMTSPIRSTSIWHAPLPVFIIAFSILFLSTLLNGCLLWALSKVDLSVLKAKSLIQSLAFVNIYLPLVTVFNLPYSGRILGILHMDLSSRICFSGVYFSLFMSAILIQSIASLGLSVDRLYAVFRPLWYRVYGYRRALRVLSIMFPYLIPLVFWGACAVAAHLMTPPKIPGVPAWCSLVYSSFRLMFYTNAFDIVLTSLHLMTFFFYMVTFISIKFNQKKMETVSTKRSTLSLSITFFVLSLTAICLYLPSPLYSRLHHDGRGQTFFTNKESLTVIYLTNSCLDPIVLMIRIRSIRRSLPCLCPATGQAKAPGNVSGSTGNTGSSGATGVTSTSNSTPTTVSS